MKFLLDENLSPLHARRLRSAGYDAVSVREMSLSGADDSVVRGAAIESGRVLVTLDGDFGNVLRYPPGDTPGIIRLRLHPPTEEAIGTALLFAVSCLGRISLEGKLAVVDERRIAFEVDGSGLDGPTISGMTATPGSGFLVSAIDEID